MGISSRIIGFYFLYINRLKLFSYRGPIGVLRFEFGVCTQGMVGPVELTCEYIKEDEIVEVGIFCNSLKLMLITSTDCVCWRNKYLFFIDYFKYTTILSLLVS